MYIYICTYNIYKVHVYDVHPPHPSLCPCHYGIPFTIPAKNERGVEGASRKYQP
jgi:hypothetical protein